MGIRSVPRVIYAALLVATSFADWALTFEDDFPGSEVNLSSWTVSDHDTTISRYDGHDALFIADNVAVSDGNLVITTAYAPNTVFENVSYNMTSGWIDSKGKRNQTLIGSRLRFEASLKMPDPWATGVWPAWWLLPEGQCWPVSGEVDIVEWWGGEGHYQKSQVGLPISASQSYHYGYGCGADLFDYNTDSTWFPSLASNSTDPTIDFSYVWRRNKPNILALLY
jgi:hypothetical protein